MSKETKQDMIRELKISSIYEIVSMIRDISGRNAKIEALKNAITHRQGFAKFLKAVYNPYIQYHIRKIPDYRVGGRIHSDIEKLLDSNKLDPLISGAKRGKEAEKWLVTQLESLDRNDAKALELIIERDIKAGVNVSSINKASPGLIPTYPCMLAKPFDQKTLEQFRFPAICQLKMDGLRANIIVRSNAVETRGRSGKSLELQSFFEPLHSLAKKFPPFVLDGEIIIRDSKNDEMLSRKKGNGIVRKFSSGKATEKEFERYVPIMIAWDLIPLSVFMNPDSAENNKENLPYYRRMDHLKNVTNTCKDMNFGGELMIIKTEDVEDERDVLFLLDEALKSGEEGVMLKDATSKWSNGRPKTQMKFKAEKECELFICGLKEGKGRLRGKLGAFICESADGLVKVDVGSGFSDDQREEYFDEELIGSVLTVKYNEKITRKDRKPETSLFLPIFVEIRSDKTEADSIEDIK